MIDISADTSTDLVSGITSDMARDAAMDLATGITIGRARPEDCEDLARLAGQLGYAVEPAVVALAIAGLEGRTDEAVIVARDENARVIGWTSVAAVHHFYTPRIAEISGFIVDEPRRARGIGSAMMDQVLLWAVAAGCPSIRLRANAIRIDAHRFYEGLGFTRTKQQIVFSRTTSLTSVQS